MVSPYLRKECRTLEQAKEERRIERACADLERDSQFLLLDVAKCTAGVDMTSVGVVRKRMELIERMVEQARKERTE